MNRTIDKNLGVLDQSVLFQSLCEHRGPQVEGDLAGDILEDEVGVIKTCEEMVEVLLDRGR